MLTYQGKSEYCYANCASMLLAAAGYRVSPHLLEVLSGVGLGAILLPDSTLLLSQVAPDTGIDNAFDRLGFTVSAAYSDNDLPWERLTALLSESPVIVGPVDLTHLPYHRSQFDTGTDHFVLAYAHEHDRVLLHDPWGYPHVRLARDDLDRAWRGDTIPYSRAPYQYWYGPPVPFTDPDGRPLADRALDGFRVDHAKASRSGQCLGDEAIDRFADAATPAALNRLADFTLPLAAARADHYAQFFAIHHRPVLANIKHAQAQLLGAAYCATASGDHLELVGLLRQLANAERRFANALLG